MVFGAVGVEGTAPLAADLEEFQEEAEKGFGLPYRWSPPMRACWHRRGTELRKQGGG